MKMIKVRVVKLTKKQIQKPAFIKKVVPSV